MFCTSLRKRPEWAAIVPDLLKSEIPRYQGKTPQPKRERRCSYHCREITRNSRFCVRHQSAGSARICLSFKCAFCCWSRPAWYTSPHRAAIQSQWRSSRCNGLSFAGEECPVRRYDCVFATSSRVSRFWFMLQASYQYISNTMSVLSPTHLKCHFCQFSLCHLFLKLCLITHAHFQSHHRYLGVLIQQQISFLTAQRTRHY